MLKEDIAANVDVLYALKEAKYRMFGLTNWSGETFPIALRRFSFFQEFEGNVVSGDAKMIKPDKEIFYLLLERYQINAENSLFIDDNLKNIESAQEIGFHTVHFSPDTDLAHQLRLMEVL